VGVANQGDVDVNDRTDELSSRARAVAATIEPVAGQVYFSPECHERYAELGFGASPGTTGNGVALPDGEAYFASRGSVMGQVPGEVVASAFAVFNPAIVVPLVAHAWTVTDAPTICACRTDGAVAQLSRILGDRPEGVDRANDLLGVALEPLRPEGKPLFAGLRSLGLPGEPLADAWRGVDMLREFRGDAHTASWTTAGLDATEVGLLTELYWGLPLRSYIRTRAWSNDDLDAATERLRARGLIDDDGFTDAGRSLREQVEVDTDRQCQPFLDALGDDLDELISILVPWGTAIRDAAGYLPSGPHELAGQSR